MSRRKMMVGSVVRELLTSRHESRNTAHGTRKAVVARKRSSSSVSDVRLSSESACLSSLGILSLSGRDSLPRRFVMLEAVMCGILILRLVDEGLREVRRGFGSREQFIVAHTRS